MTMETDITFEKHGWLTRIVYLASLFFFAQPFIISGVRRINSALSGASPSDVERVATWYNLALFIVFILVAIVRALWVVSGKTRLESPSGGTMTIAIRNVGLGLMYFGVGGSFLILGLLAISAAPAIFMLFTLPLKGTIPFGLLLFETGRILAYEQVCP